MDAHDIALRTLTYRLIVDLGRAPTAGEVAQAARADVAEVQLGWQRLHREHALVLQPDGLEIRMAHPFAAAPTAYRVLVDDRGWYANCAWDAFGICAALHSDGRIETACPDCRVRLDIGVRDQQPEPADEDLLFHCLVPASHWWDDIAFT